MERNDVAGSSIDQQWRTDFRAPKARAAALTKPFQWKADSCSIRRRECRGGRDRALLLEYD